MDTFMQLEVADDIISSRIIKTIEGNVPVNFEVASSISLFQESK